MQLRGRRLRKLVGAAARSTHLAALQSALRLYCRHDGRRKLCTVYNTYGERGKYVMLGRQTDGRKQSRKKERDRPAQAATANYIWRASGPVCSHTRCGPSNKKGRRADQGELNSLQVPALRASLSCCWVCLSPRLSDGPQCATGGGALQRSPAARTASAHTAPAAQHLGGLTCPLELRP